MGRGEHVRFERAAEELVNPLPAWILGITRNEVGEAARAKTRELEHNAAIVRAVHILDVRGKQFEIELVGEAGQVAVGELVTAHRYFLQGIVGEPPR